MDHTWAGQSSNANGTSPDFPDAIGDPFDFPPDEPFGDEAAFPSTWQQLCAADVPRD